MQNMGTRCLLLLLGLTATVQLKVPRTARASRHTGWHLNEGFQPLRASTKDNPERGDVPGWVMITLMSAVLVAALLALAGPALESMFNQAMDKVGS
ncbi:hypothetical protein FBY33_3624 [Arthrobacter sp. SLBN-112]|jgi:hypothetical protein|uniref:hypothetical protein n=1 Tax=Arthrobacter sp. SLBN-112 TaxID=2768452 RepID=UPI001150D245|nr:hypothetical protein [Arthrobacter sp. SLBN-112]TQJ41509.1 hypothetical protein FBY33_3624 [Arthrobacter sp. SLBN-112]